MPASARRLRSAEHHSHRCFSAEIADRRACPHHQFIVKPLIGRVRSRRTVAAAAASCLVTGKLAFAQFAHRIPLIAVFAGLMKITRYADMARRVAHPVLIARSGGSPPARSPWKGAPSGERRAPLLRSLQILRFQQPVPVPAQRRSGSTRCPGNVRRHRSREPHLASCSSASRQIAIEGGGPKARRRRIQRDRHSRRNGKGHVAAAVKATWLIPKRAIGMTIRITLRYVAGLCLCSDLDLFPGGS